ncbi:MAG: DUF3943 domain-containing protein [Betaproteobacteria bacterium]
MTMAIRCCSEVAVARVARGHSIASRLRWVLICATSTLGLTSGPAAFAVAADYDNLPLSWAALANDSALGASALPELGASSEIAAKKNYAIPALEIIGFDALLNLHNRNYISDDYASTFSSIRRNLRSGWNVDRDPFTTNQLGHPYQGSMYFGFSRSAGLGFWESFGYTFAGSALWEIAGETTPPSKNDQINTGIGGTFLGEALFRMASLVLEDSEISPFWRELGAAAISPFLGFNRLAFGNRFDTIFPSHGPAYYSRLQLGFSGTAQNDAGTSTTKLERNEALADYSLDYGLPGKPGYTYTRPFDYFTFQATASSANGFENLMTRGLLVGKDYEAGPDYRGVFGLYGSFEYIAPQTYRVSSTALSLGTSGQWWLSEAIALQGSALFGAGYAAVGATHSTSEIDYNYGLAPQGLVALRLIVGDRVSLDLTGREYFVTGVGASARGGHDNIVRLDAGITFRVYKRHGMTIKYVGNRRDSSYPGVGDTTQARGTIGLFYTYLGHDGLGAVEWR